MKWVLSLTRTITSLTNRQSKYKLLSENNYHTSPYKSHS